MSKVNLEGFKKVEGSSLKNEILSGITVALALVPEAIAFAFVAGVDPKIGLYTAFIIGFIASIFGGRPGMISGATGAIAIVFVSLVAKQGVEYLFTAVILMGIIQVLFGLLKLGKFARIIPHPVMLGFVNGLAIVIFKAQFSSFKGVEGINLVVMLVLIALTMAIIHFLPKLTKAVPSSLVAIIAVTGISILLNSKGFQLDTVKDLAGGTLAGGFPKFHIPQVNFSIETLQIVFPYALTAALVGLIESLLTLTLVDELTNTRGRSNKECIGQGMANIITGFFGGMGGCAMIGQSMINVTSGGKRRLSGIVASLGLISFILFGSKAIEMISMSALVGVMFMVVIGTFAWESLKLSKKVPKKDIAIIVIVTVITVLHDLALAVIVGIILSALIFAWEKGKKIEAKTKDSENKKEYFLEGPIFFASITGFKNLFNVDNDPEKVIIDFANSQIVDHSAIEAVNSITQKYREAGKTLVLRHLSEDCRQLLINAKDIIEVNIKEDPHYKIADDILD